MRFPCKTPETLGATEWLFMAPFISVCFFMPCQMIWKIECHVTYFTSVQPFIVVNCLMWFQMVWPLEWLVTLQAVIDTFFYMNESSYGASKHLLVWMSGCTGSKWMACLSSGLFHVFLMCLGFQTTCHNLNSYKFWAFVCYPFWPIPLSHYQPNCESNHLCLHYFYNFVQRQTLFSFHSSNQYQWSWNSLEGSFFVAFSLVLHLKWIWIDYRLDYGWNGNSILTELYFWCFCWQCLFKWSARV